MDEDLVGKPKKTVSRWSLEATDSTTDKVFPNYDEIVRQYEDSDGLIDHYTKKRSIQYFQESEAKNKLLQDIRTDVDVLRSTHDPHMVLVSTEPVARQYTSMASHHGGPQDLSKPTVSLHKPHTSFLKPYTVEIQRSSKKAF